MPGTDRIQWFTRERLLSTDMNTDGRWRGRNLLELVRNGFASVELNSDNDAPQSQSTKAFVLGGLRMIPGTGGVTITAGILTQFWTTGIAPSSDESQYVLGESFADTIVPIAVPGADTWYLVQARATTTTTNTTRDEWNPGTESFDPVVVAYKLENTIEYNVKAGTATDLPVPDVGWIPLGGVKRLASGVDSTTKEMVDLRPLYDRKNISVQTGGHDAGVTGYMVTSHYESTTPTVTAGNTISFNVDRQTDLGNMFARVRGDGFVDITDAAFKDPSTVFAANVWYYVYLAVWGVGTSTGSLPRQAYNNVTCQGILLISHVPPDEQGSSAMPSGVTLPPPFSADTGRAGNCIFALRRNSNNTGWVATQLMNRKQYIYDETLYVNAVSPVAIGAGVVPINARVATIALLRNTPGTSVFCDVKRASIPVQLMGRVSTPTADYTEFAMPCAKLDPAAVTLELTNPGEIVSMHLRALEF